MPESRDRLSRAIDIAALFARRRSGILGVYEDQPDLERALFGSPVRPPMVATRTGAVGMSPIGHGRGGLGTPRGQTGRGRNIYRTPAIGRENTPIGSARRGNSRGRGRASNSALPSWYPRTPLRDITAIVRAIERRERLGADRAQEIESPVPHAYGVLDSSEPSSVAHLEHSNTIMSPIPSLQVKRCPPTVGKIPKILLDITNQSSEDSDFLTPQKKLLNSIDTVEKEVMEELRKLKRTASAKKAEREKKVRTLMSMR
ncbi:hypothetical protein P3X46_007872 [Hevea brasiliensis]|uniref:Protein POLYCHOME-like n=1 Tax=Hevea brasiliensis TaxID=3981 RepID=A0ABQ9MVV2_HEVBR|nr:protein POLYCHOME [Hevea brasiliensis]XP_021644946.2 protein POLYCHOME [Hevea brasiliensis]KAJ9184098.1 hypothetical protein P3X46_007872 [Hevea brasiliensis]